jgi:hypothetical protein
MSATELVDLVDVAELVDHAGRPIADVAACWPLPPELVLAELRRRPYPCPLALLGAAERRGMVIRDERGRRIYDSRPGRPDEGTAPPVQIGI